MLKMVYSLKSAKNFHQTWTDLAETNPAMIEMRNVEKVDGQHTMPFHEQNLGFALARGGATMLDD